MAATPLLLGVLTDTSSDHADPAGNGAVAAVRMAVDECRQGLCAGMDIRVIAADAGNDPDAGAGIAREWMDRDGVDAVIDLSSDDLRLAVLPLIAERSKLAILASGTARLTGDACYPDNLVQWMTDSYGPVAALTKRLTKPDTKWFLVAADDRLGLQLARDVRAMVTALGGTYLGSVRHPVPSNAMSSFLLTAQTSGADIVALADAGDETVDGVKTAHGFGIPSAAQHLVAFSMTANDVHGLGLDAAQGITVAGGFWWNLDDGTRDFAKRFRARTGGAMPSADQAGLYSATLHYLKAVKASGSRDPATVLAKMRDLPIEDDVVRHGKLRRDGRMVHDYYVFQVKAPQDSAGEWDIYTLLATLPGDAVFRPMSATLCPKLPQ